MQLYFTSDQGQENFEQLYINKINDTISSLQWCSENTIFSHIILPF